MLISSSNDAADAVASFIERKEGANFASLMNEEAKARGLSRARFHNPTGLDPSLELSGGYGTAEEISHLLASTYQDFPEIFGESSRSEAVFYSTDGRAHEIKNTDKILSDFPEIAVSKTGFTDLAGGNLALFLDLPYMKDGQKQNTLVSVIILGSSVDGRFEDAKKLISATIRAMDYWKQER